VKDQSGDVIENKGSAFINPRQSGNVVENKGSYASKAGMLLKIKGLGAGGWGLGPGSTCAGRL
jgi:hypothetical protein